jgi:hypothetical protein
MASPSLPKLARNRQTATRRGFFDNPSIHRRDDDARIPIWEFASMHAAMQ